MSRSQSNSSSNAGQSQPDSNPDPAPKLSDKAPVLPTQTSYEAGWSSATFEYYCLPPGETPEMCIDHYVAGICCNQISQVEMKVEGVTNGRWQTLPHFYGGVFLYPMHHSCSARFQQPFKCIMLNLKPGLLTDSAAEFMGRRTLERVEETTMHWVTVFMSTNISFAPHPLA